jgi:hypothetical protein
VKPTDIRVHEIAFAAAKSLIPRVGIAWFEEKREESREESTVCLDTTAHTDFTPQESCQQVLHSSSAKRAHTERISEDRCRQKWLVCGVASVPSAVVVLLKVRSSRE